MGDGGVRDTCWNLSSLDSMSQRRSRAWHLADALNTQKGRVEKISWECKVTDLSMTS